MAVRVPELPTLVDLLIAEANRRTRRRRAVLAAVLAVAVLATGAMVMLRSPAGVKDAGSALGWSTLPTLHGAAAFVTLVAVDRTTDMAEFRVRCGVFVRFASPSTGTIPPRKLARAEVRPGLYRASLRGGSFWVSVYADTPTGALPSSGNQVTLAAWERDAPIGSGWQFRTGAAGPYVGNGPTTDMCHGVLG